MQYINCGILNYKNKKVIISLNNDFKKEFFIIENGKLKLLDEPYRNELDKIYNKKIDCFYLTESLKKKIASLLLATTIISGSGSLVNAHAIEKEEVTNETLYLNEYNILEGIKVDDGYITRGEVCQILYNLNNNSRVSLLSFNDVPDDDMYAEAINWANEKGIVKGYDGNFNSNDSITKEQFVTILYRYIKNTSSVVTDGDKQISNQDISSYAIDASNWAIKNKIIDMSEPNSYITRNSIIEIIYNFISKYNLCSNYDRTSGYIQQFITTVDDNENIPESVKEVFKTYSYIFKDYNISDEAMLRICNRFASMQVGIGEESLISSGMLGCYYPDSNCINYYNELGGKLSQNTIFHEGFHAITNNIEDDVVGFCEINTGFGFGLTEGINKTLDLEYVNAQTDYGYYVTSNLVYILAGSIDPDELLKNYIEADLPSLIDSIMSVYSKQYSREESYTKTINLIASFDTINLFETDQLPQDMEFIQRTVAELDNLLYLSKGYNIKDDALMNAYYEKIFNRNEYFCYLINNYVFNKKFVDDEKRITKISKDKALADPSIEQMSFVTGKNNLVSAILAQYPEYVETIEINQNINKTK